MLDDKPAPARQAGARDEDRPPLTRREAEVAQLLARGLSNKQIPDRLVLSPRTVETHVEHILAKFGFTSRTQVAAWYARRPDPEPPAV